ncbi:hypothetical protein CRG98_013552 [Punica granatum]|uniref:Uncharacterized protein n=1 Tax=Punica granatum TaxID=22663 RepID=A0A2I0KC10_PUNGR|nr:hypothetical protein CRG98_013552 [Punica granatum]
MPKELLGTLQEIFQIPMPKKGRKQLRFHRKARVPDDISDGQGGVGKCVVSKVFDALSGLNPYWHKWYWTPSGGSKLPLYRQARFPDRDSIGKHEISD